MRPNRPVKAGNGWVTAGPMTDSSSLLRDGQLDTARQRLAKDGYLMLRQYLPQDAVLEVCSSLLLNINSNTCL